MDTEEILERLIDADVVESVDDQITPTEEFAARRSQLRDNENDPDRPDWLTSDLVDDGNVDFRATVTAVFEFVDGMDERDIVAAARAFDRLENPPKSSGAPENFVPLHQEDLRGFLEAHSAAVIYVWKPGSSSCAEMADTLGQLHERPIVDESVGLGSICVADGADRLRHEYDVSILPTTLYFVGQTVDVRNVGPRELDHVEREVEIITELANESAPADSQSNA